MYSLYANGVIVALGSAVFGGSILITVVTLGFGIKMWSDSKKADQPGYGKIVAMLHWGIAGIGIMMFGDWAVKHLIMNTRPSATFEAVLIHLLLGIGVVLVSWRTLRKPDNLANLCRCAHSMEAHFANGSECSICMCKHFGGISND